MRVVHGVPELSALPEREPLPLNFGREPPPGKQRRSGPGAAGGAGAAAGPCRVGDHAVPGPPWTGTWRHLGLIVSDFLYLDGQRERGPAMAFIRCDPAAVYPTDHHTLAMALMPAHRLLHSAYQLTDLDEVAAGGAFLRDRRYRHAWGIGRHIQGSQIFDYWQDPDQLMFEHYADGDLFDSSMEPRVGAAVGERPGPVGSPGIGACSPGTKDPAMVLEAIKALRDKGNEVDLAGGPRAGEGDRSS